MLDYFFEKHSIKTNTVQTFNNVDKNVFKQIEQLGRPAVLKDCNFGPCMQLWTLDYLIQKLRDIDVVIHESNENELDFINKNFKYKTCKFEEFANLLVDENRDANQQCAKHVYLRSVSSNRTSKNPANINDDFPQISADLQPPNFVPYEKAFSSILRIASSNLQVWTHFDLYDNVLCQVVGRRRVILFSPEDSDFLYMQDDKSMINNFDNLDKCIDQYPLIKQAIWHCLTLERGDCLYIPSCWWHNIRSLPDNLNSFYSICFNIFWNDKSIEKLYKPNDTYGNANLAPVDSAVGCVDKAIGQLKKLPPKYRSLYAAMLASRIKNKLEI